MRKCKHAKRYQGLVHTEERLHEDTVKALMCKPRREASKKIEPIDTSILNVWPPEI